LPKTNFIENPKRGTCSSQSIRAFLKKELKFSRKHHDLHTCKQKIFRTNKKAL